MTNRMNRKKNCFMTNDNSRKPHRLTGVVFLCPDGDPGRSLDGRDRQECLREIGKGFVSRSDFNTKNEELKTAKSTLKERDGQLEQLKKSAGNTEELTKQIEQLQKDNAQKDKDHAAALINNDMSNTAPRSDTARRPGRSPPPAGGPRRQGYPPYPPGAVLPVPLPGGSR